MRSSLSIWKDRVIFTSPSLVAESSCRPTITLLLAPRGLVRVTTADGLVHIGRALIIAPSVQRSLNSNGGSLYSFIFDPTHRIAKYLCNSIINRNSVVDLSDRVTQDMAVRTQLAIEEIPDCAECFKISEYLLSSLFPESVGMQSMDQRIEMITSRLMKRVKENADDSALSAMCGLSRGRLSHLFKNEMGLSIRSYRLWIKMREAAEYFIENRSLTEVAQLVRFSDSAHLSRTFKEYFALAPSFLSNEALVKVHVCDSYRS